MKKYVETKGETAFNWFESLSKENISEEEWNNMIDLSSSFITCACGNLCEIIPRKDNDEPEDDILAILGQSFYDTIQTKNVMDALQVLSFIEIRAAYLIDIELGQLEIKRKHLQLLKNNNLL